MNWLVESALKIARMPDATIADLEKALPGFASLAADLKDLEPILAASQPCLEALEPLAVKAWPILLRAYPKLVAVIPTTEELIAFVANKPQVA